MSKVLYKQGTKSDYLGISSVNDSALYFCTDTRELFKGSNLYTDGIRIVDNYAALPALSAAADGKLYFCMDSKCGYVLNNARNGWNRVLCGVDDTTIEVNENGLLSVKAIPVSSVTGLGARLSSSEASISSLETKVGSDSVSSQITTAISALDVSDSAVSGQYVSSVREENGKITVERAAMLSQTDYSIALSESATPEAGYFKTYELKQGAVGSQVVVGKINIPKDFLVKSATIAEKGSSGAWGAAGTYLDFVINSKDSSETGEHIYVNVTDMFDAYTAESPASQVQLTISNANVISATLVAGSIGTNELNSNVNAAINKAHEHSNKTVIDGITATKVANWDSATGSAIDSVKVNGSALTATNKAVDVLITEGSENGSISVNNASVPVHGLGSAAYTQSSAYDASGSAANVIGQADDEPSEITVYGVKAYANSLVTWGTF